MSAVDLGGFASLLNSLRDRAATWARGGRGGKASMGRGIEAEARVLPRLALEMAARLDRAALVQAFAATATHCLAPLSPDDLRHLIDQADMLLEPEPEQTEPRAQGLEGGRSPGETS